MLSECGGCGGLRRGWLATKARVHLCSDRAVVCSLAALTSGNKHALTILPGDHDRHLTVCADCNARRPPTHKVEVLFDCCCC